VIVRPATDADTAALAAIYGHHVRHVTGAFEETPRPGRFVEGLKIGWGTRTRT
jgi:L-amino acid N-acyltransferase YncA